MRDKIKAAVLAAFAADALCLGVHWIYDPDRIRSRYGRVDRFHAPDKDSYHKRRKKGEFTHYGDQMLVLLESIAASGRFSATDFSEKWQHLFESYDGYVDGASRTTLANYKNKISFESAGSGSNDFAGASRMAPLALVYGDDADGFEQAAREQTRITHNAQLPMDAAGFFARVCYLVLHGKSPAQAIKEVVAMEPYRSSPLSALVEAGLQSSGLETQSAIEGFGPACDAGQALPGVIHLITRYENNLKKALVECAMAGGDSSARGIMTGMVLGAFLGMAAIPSRWIEEMAANQRIARLIEAAGIV